MQSNLNFIGRFFFGLFVIAASLLTQSSFSQNPTSLKEHTIEIVYSPKGQSLTQEYEIFIANNGTAVLYKMDYYTKDWYGDFKYSVNYSKPKAYSSVKSAKVPEKEFNELKRMVLDTDIFRFNDEYIGSTSVLGYRGEIVTFVVDGRTKKILISASSFPVELARLIRKIEKIKDQIDNLPL